MAIKTAKELVQAALDVAQNYKTLYVMGCFGAPMNQSNKTRYINGYTFNAKDERKAKIQAATADTFGFDCVCFIKALFWGWRGDSSQIYGGAAYKSNGVPDIGADQMLKVCTDVSTDFSAIVPGELVWLPGHVGIYVGDGMAAEATWEPDEGVQLQCVLPMGVKPGMPSTGWVKHGKLPWISYEEKEEESKDPVEIPVSEKLYRVTIEGLPKDKADNLAQAYSDLGLSALVEEVQTKAETKPAVPETKPVEPTWTPNVGDIVYFKGGLQYSSSNGVTGSQRGAGQAKITKAFGGKHPYHLVKTGSSGPYGWVDRDTFEKV